MLGCEVLEGLVWKALVLDDFPTRPRAQGPPNSEADRALLKPD